jgi:hypothetical protein
VLIPAGTISSPRLDGGPGPGGALVAGEASPSVPANMISRSGS